MAAYPINEATVLPINEATAQALSLELDADVPHKAGRKEEDNVETSGAFPRRLSGCDLLPCIPAASKPVLNIQPTLWLAIPFFVAACATSAFLEYVVESAAAHFAVFGVGSYIVFASYFVCDFQLSRRSTSYASIPDDKKFYVLSNLIKAAVLLSYSPLAGVTLYRALVRDEWETLRIRNLGVLYAIPDCVSLFLVSRMALTTKIHHVCVVVFMVLNLMSDYSLDGVPRALVVYAVFSTFAYLVNLLLASRFLQVHVWAAFTMSALALLVYVSCLAVNWTWQVWFLSRLWQSGEGHKIKICVYVSVIALVMYDDVVLVGWLRSNARKKLKLVSLSRDGKTQ